ncbi:MAG: sucrase ferredoxin, partial [Candidatus Dadabacteria bacterium]|nr:sucrase ferredoxin [Candidatus Dadabacteria bacterium]
LSGIRLYIAITTQSEKKLFEFIIDSYNQILELDFEKVLTLENLKTIPLLLICTHGSYDQCCGTRGVELYNKLSAIEEKFDVWQTTHLGGHRFASNILLLPEGIYYGRVNEDNYTLIKNQYSKHR